MEVGRRPERSAEFARITGNIPEENRWSKVRDEESGIGGFMEKNTVVCTTDTIPIPVLDVERKTLPVMSIKLEARNSKSETQSSNKADNPEKIKS